MHTLKTSLPVSDEDYRIVGLAVLAIAIHVFESAIPSPIPGVKPGLANVITLAVYFLFGLRFAVWVTILRVLVGSIVMGTFLSPTFLLSASGALSSILVLWCVYKGGGFGLTCVGLAILTSMAHISGQFAIAYIVFIQHEAIFYLLPVLLTAALIFGLATGFIARELITRVTQELGSYRGSAALFDEKNISNSGENATTDPNI